MKTMQPRNAKTGRFYTGKNVGRLLEAMVENDFESEEFCTFVQARDLGRPVPKDVKACAAIIRLVKPKAKKGQAKKGKPKLVPTDHYVWNLDQLPEAV